MVRAICESLNGTLIGIETEIPSTSEVRDNLEQCFKVLLESSGRDRRQREFYRWGTLSAVLKFFPTDAENNVIDALIRYRISRRGVKDAIFFREIGQKGAWSSSAARVAGEHLARRTALTGVSCFAG